MKPAKLRGKEVLKMNHRAPETDLPAEANQKTTRTGKARFDAQTSAFWLLRLWLGARAIATGLDKFSAQKRVIDENIETGEMSVRIVREYSFDNYIGIPAQDLDILLGNPIFPEWLLRAFAFVLGPALILFGAMVIVGICTRFALLALGIIFVMLTFGISFMGNADAGSLGIHVGLVVAALLLSKRKNAL